MNTITQVRPIRIGVAVAAGYLVACVGTIALTTHHVRPLFEGFAPPAPYQWVNPPSQFASGNVKPKPFAITVTLGPTGTAAGDFYPPDAQAVFNLPDGAIPPRDTDTSVKIEIEPLDPAKLGPLTQPLNPDGNAYRITLTYEPSGQPVGPLAKPGNVILVVPQTARSLMFSTDGRTWQQLPTQAVGGSASVGATFNGAGYFLAAAHGATGLGGGTSSHPNSNLRTVLIAAGAVGLALGLAFVPPILRRRSRRAERNRKRQRPRRRR